MNKDSDWCSWCIADLCSLSWPHKVIDNNIKDWCKDCYNDKGDQK